MYVQSMHLNSLTLAVTMPVHMFKGGTHGLISWDIDYDQFVCSLVRLVFVQSLTSS
jgi:hypothetical protein